MLAIAYGRPVPPAEPWVERDTTASGFITRAYLAAASGDTTSARRLLLELRARPSTRRGLHGATPEFVEACIAARGGRWGTVVELVAQAAREGSDRGSGIVDRIGVAPERLLVAQAYEQLGRPDSAAAFYERLLAPESSRMLDSFARARLVVLYARMARWAEAGKHLAILERDFTRPDGDVRHLLDEARTAVRNARGGGS
jgi:hypothetical protein